MREVLFRLREAAADRLTLAGWACLALLGLALLAGPLMSAPGYELSLGLSVLLGASGGYFAALFGQAEAKRTGTPQANAAAAFGAAFAALLLAQAPVLLVATVWTTFFTPCNPFEGAGFVPLLPVPSAALAAALGVLLGVAVTRRWVKRLWWVALVVGSLGWAAWPVLFGPQVFAYSHLLGYLPGPLYDEVLRVEAPLLWFRGGTLALCGVVVTLAVLRLEGGTKARRRALWALALLFLVVEANGTALGFRMSDRALEAVLGGRRETPTLTVIHSTAVPKEQMDRAVRDLEFRFAQVSSFLGGAPPGKVRVWWYESAEQKRQLVGAAHTQFAKPWRREVHVNPLDFPHRVIKHELVHALAAPLGAPPFGATARLLGLSPHIGVIEGLAVAADNPVDELTLHEWAAAMKKKNLLPDVRVLLEPAGFYAAPPSRAYTTAGSFLRYLGDTHGTAKLRALYRNGDFAGVYGEPLSKLATDYERFLDSVPLEPGAVHQAFDRFRQGSLFDRTCARQVARQSEEAAGLAPHTALVHSARCRAIQPDEPSHALAQVRALRQLGADADARAVLETQLLALEPYPGSWANAALTLVDLLLELGDEAKARALLERLVALDVSPAVERTSRVRLLSLDLPQKSRAAVDAYFGPMSAGAQALVLSDAIAAEAPQPVLSYLLGRRLSADADAPLAEAALSQALAGELPDAVRLEALRLATRAAFLAGRCDRVADHVAEAHRRSAAQGKRLTEWLDRCAFEALRYGGPLRAAGSAR